MQLYNKTRELVKILQQLQFNSVKHDIQMQCICNSKYDAFKGCMVEKQSRK